MKKELILDLIKTLMTMDDNDKAASDDTNDTNVDLIGMPVIVRCVGAGVHFGYYKRHKGREVELTGSRRMYRWKAKTQMTLSAVAKFGLDTKWGELKIQNTLKHIVLLDACEIIPCTEECVSSFNLVEPYNEN